MKSFFLGAFMAFQLALTGVMGVMLIDAKTEAAAFKAMASYPQVQEEQENLTLKVMKVVQKRSGNTIGLDRAYHIARATIEASHETGASLPLMLSIIQSESHFNPKATSHMGARGLYQVMPFWASKMEFIKHPDELYDIYTNARAAARIIKIYQDKCGTQINQFMWCYNAGPANYFKKRLPAETKVYLKVVNEREQHYRNQLESIQV